MEQSARTGARIEGGSASLRGLAWLGGVIATACAAVVAAILAIVFTATVAVLALMSGVVIALGSIAWRAKRSVRPVRRRDDDPTIIEARNVGGHSWVAYGWDQQGR